MKVEQLMTKSVRTCTVWETLNDAARVMWENDCGCVPVVAGDGRNQVVGVLTDRDVCMAAYTQGRPLCEISVESVMTRAVLSCRPGDTLADAEATLRAGRVRRLPVVDDAGHLLGLLSLADLAREAARESGSRRPAVKAIEVGATLAEISRPRLLEAGGSEPG